MSTYLGKATERTNKPQNTGISWFGLKEIIHGSREKMPWSSYHKSINHTTMNTFKEMLVGHRWWKKKIYRGGIKLLPV